METTTDDQQNERQRTLTQLKNTEMEFYRMQLVSHWIILCFALSESLLAIIVYSSSFLESDFLYILVSCLYGAQSFLLDIYCKSCEKQIKKKLTFLYTLLSSSLNPAIANEKAKIETILRDDCSISAYGDLLLLRVYIGYIVLCARAPFCNWAIVFGFLIDLSTIVRLLFSFNHTTWKLTHGAVMEICHVIRAIRRKIASTRPSRNRA
ncbi:unnamed protein product, partial [Mesorhabditis belari]|uniref:Uncharacterized protein n=1 Tax=Mesorhabditis belari TaxID=2138241 RepID=A0AAF3F4K8_9BILA